MEEIDLKELIDMFLEKKFLIILVVLIFSILGAVYTLEFITPKYESFTKLVLVQTGSESSTTEISNSITTTDITLNSKLVDDYIEIAESKIVASTVVDNLKLNMPTETLQKNITVTSIADSMLIQITVEDTDPEQACEIANEVAKVFMEKINDIYKVSNVHVLDVAEVPQGPSNVNLVKNIIIFAFIGAILVAGYILLVNMLDTTVKTDSDIEKNLSVPVLASIALTGENTKKKKKKSNSSKAEISYSDNVQFYYGSETNNTLSDNEEKKEKEVVEEQDENVSLFSYVKDDNSNNIQNHQNQNSNYGKHKKSQRRGGRK